MHTAYGPWIVPALFAVAAVAGCGMVKPTSTSPGPSAELPAGSTDAAIDKLGNAACTFFLGFRTKGKAPPDPAIKKTVDDNWARLKQAGERSPEQGDAIKKIKWQVSVIDDPSDKNAYACPGGKIVVSTGILRVAKDDDGLAAVLGHEMTHVLARHTSPPLDKAIIADAPAIAAGMVAIHNVDDLSPDAKRVLAAFGLGSIVGVTSQAFSREQELEADRGGLLRMAEAGYDPSRYQPFLRRLGDKDCVGADPKAFGFLASHPDPEIRREELAKLSDLNTQASELYQKAQKPAQVKELPGKNCVDKPA